MSNPSPIRPPVPQYEILRLPNGKHSGACFDARRFVLEIQRDGIKYYFDLALFSQGIDKLDEVCYTQVHER
jgi:hypothetical protein